MISSTGRGERNQEVGLGGHVTSDPRAPDKSPIIHTQKNIHLLYRSPEEYKKIIK